MGKIWDNGASRPGLGRYRCHPGTSCFAKDRCICYPYRMADNDENSEQAAAAPLVGDNERRASSTVRGYLLYGDRKSVV